MMPSESENFMPHVMSVAELAQTRRAVEAMIASGGSFRASLETVMTMADLLATVDALQEVWAAEGW